MEREKDINEDFLTYIKLFYSEGKPIYFVLLPKKNYEFLKSSGVVTGYRKMNKIERFYFSKIKPLIRSALYE